MFYFNIALKSIIARRRQYKALFAVCAVGVCLMLSALMITDGMLNSMNEKARQYYGGDIQLLGGSALLKPESEADKEIEVLKSFIKDKNVVYAKRNTYDGQTSTYYFEGVSVRQRAIMAVDFEHEHVLFDKFTFVEGTYKRGDYEDTVLLSEPVAKKLGCHAGDSVTFYTTTDDGYVNTIDLVLTGIFQDASVFGMYTSYMNIGSLNKVLNLSTPLINRISMYYLNGSPSRNEMLELQKSLETVYDMYPFGIDKQAFYDDYLPSGLTKYCLVPLESNVSDLKLLVQALRLIVVAIILVLVIIISVGISSTYRVIVIKRSLESGTLRAIGMTPSGVMKMFVVEAFLLLLAGCITGFTGALIISRIASFFNLSFISGFDLFLTGGRLVPHINLLKITELLSVIIVTTLGSVLFTLRKLVHISPVGAIAATT